MQQDIDNAFAELGLTPDATEAQVKAAWRRLVSRWHPDRNDSAAAVARMQRINRALEAIRHAGFESEVAPAAPQADPRPAESPKPTPEPEADPTVETESDAGNAPTRPISRRVKLTLEEAAFGCTRVLHGKLNSRCSACAGVGQVLPGGHCPRCHGSGAVRQGAWFGWMGTEVECEACHGGGLARQVCDACAGSGKAAAQRYRVTVRFPHGVRDGDLLSVKATLGPPGSANSELSIRVDLQPHAWLLLDPDGTVRCDLPVDGFAWMANRVVDMPTLDGLRKLPLQREQRVYRLEGQGFPVLRRGPRGDQVVTLMPVFPQQLSTDQQILLDQLIASTSGPGVEPADERLRAWNHALRSGRRGSRTAG